MSIHIAAQEGQIAEAVLFWGSIAAQYIAETFLENACYNMVRKLVLLNLGCYVSSDNQVWYGDSFSHDLR